MKYFPLPTNTKLLPSQFIAEVNKALKSLPEYKTGMHICSDINGYWLEILGVKNFENDDLMSIARNLVLVNNEKEEGED